MTEISIEQRIAGLTQIAKEVGGCVQCDLYKGRTHAVPGAGPANAEVLFIGEGPGFHEDQQGLPFVGNSGKLLESLLASIQMDRKQVFITNVVKCRPPDNRDPLPAEIDTCTKSYLFRQIELLNPKVIATLGRYSMGLFFPNAKITAVHGKPRWESGRAYLPLFHPAAVLRNPALRTEAFEDFAQIPRLLAEWAKHAAPSEPPPASDLPPPTQLSLF